MNRTVGGRGARRAGVPFAHRTGRCYLELIAKRYRTSNNISRELVGKEKCCERLDFGDSVYRMKVGGEKNG